MTALAISRSHSDGDSEEGALGMAWPLLAILFVEGALFVWMAPRGLDFTDESYYLLSYLHWREFSATATFFGAYFEWPFRLLGQHVAWIRIFGMALLLASGAFFTWRAMAFRPGGYGGERRVVTLPFAICGTVSALFYYSYGTTLRAPSYNLLVLFCMLTATGLLLYLVDGSGARRWRCAAALAYGLVLGACALGKATSAVAMLVCHAAFLIFFNRGERALELAAIALLGVALNFLVLQLMQPEWFHVLRRGVAFTLALDGRYASIPVSSLREAVMHGAQRLLPAVLAAAAFAIVVRRLGRGRPKLLSWLVVLLVLAITLTIQLQGYGKSWWVLWMGGAALLWLVVRLCGERSLPSRGRRAELGLSILLFTLPIAYSLGTNGSLPAHTQMATIFGIVAVMLPLRQLLALGLVQPIALSVALSILCLPTLVSEALSLSNPSFTYRLRAGVEEQRWPVSLGPAGDVLMVDATTRDSVDAFAAAMRNAGYRAGEPVLDVTGDGPGLVYAIGGNPPGVGWLIGGYSGSEQVAALVLDTVPVETLRRTWIISTDGNPRSLRTWVSLVAGRSGESSHVLAGTVPYRAQYRWVGAPTAPVTLSLWKPAASLPLRAQKEKP